MLQFQTNRYAGRDGGPSLSPVVVIGDSAHWVDLVPTEVLEALDHFARTQIAKLAAEWLAWNTHRREDLAPTTEPHPIDAIGRGQR